MYLNNDLGEGSLLDLLFNQDGLNGKHHVI